jgi:hypothetical protein
MTTSPAIYIFFSLCECRKFSETLIKYKIMSEGKTAQIIYLKLSFISLPVLFTFCSSPQSLAKKQNQVHPADF